MYTIQAHGSAGGACAIDGVAVRTSRQARRHPAVVVGGDVVVGVRGSSSWEVTGRAVLVYGRPRRARVHELMLRSACLVFLKTQQVMLPVGCLLGGGPADAAAEAGRVFEMFDADGGGASRRRACHFADTPSPSLLKRLLQGKRGAAE